MIRDATLTDDAVFFTAGPEILFNQNMATIAKLCLPPHREVELWLRLEVWQNGGSNLYNLRIVDFNMGQVYATADKPHEDEKEKTFTLYWRGRLPAGQPELTIQYQATQRFPLAQSKPNGFFYGYRIMPEGYSQIVASEPHPCPK